tara:strand:- start:6 stop:413 length:408 start_codon:yes stop_codon:yes gene_type:complete
MVYQSVQVVMVEQLLVLLVEMMVVMEQMEVIVSLIQVVLNKGKELVVEVEQLIIPLIFKEDQVVVVEEHLHIQIRQVDQQHNHPHLDQEQIMDNLVEDIKILIQELLVVLVGHQLVVEEQGKQDSVLQMLDPCNK